MEQRAILGFAIGILPHNELAITPLVNDVPLPQLVADFEEMQKYDPIGGYGGIVPNRFDYGRLDRYFLGDHEPNSYWAKMGAVYVLGCECGEVGCWPLQCRIREANDEVVWEEFLQPHRPSRNYSGFGRFVFDALQYREAVLKLLNDLSPSEGDLS